MPYEGSVDIDGEGYDDEVVDETTSESESDINNSSTSDEELDNDGAVSTTTDDQPDDQTDDQTDDSNADGKTDKGTKLATDPLQQANQLRANAESRAKEYEALLMDPEGLERYLEDLKGATNKGQGKQPEIDVSQETKELLDINPDKIETVEDLRAYAKGLQQTVMQEVGTVKQAVSGMMANQQTEVIGKRITGGIDAVKAKYPELREKNSDGTPNPLFNPVFDQKLGDLIERFDFDPKTKSFRGQVDIVKLADDLADIIKVGRNKGSVEAQTIIKDRRVGKVSQGASGSSPDVDESKLSPSQIIAGRIKRSRSVNHRR